MHSYTFEHPAITVDLAVFAFSEIDGVSELQVLVIRRKEEPFEGEWALPGGFVRIEETVDDAAHRELEEETGLADAPLEFFKAYSEPGRDPRFTDPNFFDQGTGSRVRVVTHAYIALWPGSRTSPNVIAGSDAAEAEWVPLWKILKIPRLIDGKVIRKGRISMAFDHYEIVWDAYEHLRRLADGLHPETARELAVLLPKRFTYAQLQGLFETISGIKYDKRNFRRKLSDPQWNLIETDEKGGKFRPTTLLQLKQ